ncbi:MAG: SRPBCC family protein [Actinomycetota bacterium]|nr:SRPBCC family protein [Actinomycetota bacterium]
MIEYRTSRCVAVTSAAVFDVIGTHVYENHPRWEREVIEIKPLAAGPIGAGSEAGMVRKDFLRRKEVVYRCTDFQAGRRIAFDHPGSSMGFKLAFDVEPLPDEGAEVRITVSAQPRGLARLFEPMMRKGFPKRTERIVDQMMRVIEERAHTATARG